jgi:hypothetical protein
MHPFRHITEVLSDALRLLTDDLGMSRVLGRRLGDDGEPSFACRTCGKPDQRVPWMTLERKPPVEAG